MDIIKRKKLIVFTNKECMFQHVTYENRDIRYPATLRIIIRKINMFIQSKRI